MKKRERYTLGVLSVLTFLTGLAYLYIVTADLAFQAEHGGAPFSWERVAVTVFRGILVNLFSAFAVALLVTLFLYGQLADVQEAASRKETREQYRAQTSEIIGITSELEQNDDQRPDDHPHRAHAQRVRRPDAVGVRAGREE